MQRHISFVTAVLLAITLGYSSYYAQNRFEKLNTYIRSHDTGWQESRVHLSEEFQKERSSLGSRFEKEVLDYTQNSERRSYWISLFLDSEAYLHGAERLTELALRIRLRGIEIGPEKLTGASADLNPGKPDVRALAYRLGMHVLAAISAKKLGRNDLATSLKKVADSILSDNGDLAPFLPRLSPFNSCIYRMIDGPNRDCSNEKKIEPAEGTVDNIVVNGKPISMPRPIYQGKWKGRVEVEAVVDERGDVISARAANGPADLRALVVQAALNAKFTPTTFFGRPWIVTTPIIFDFR